MNTTLTLDIPRDRTADLLCSALEGGSNYWYSEAHVYDPDQNLPAKLDCLDDIFNQSKYYRAALCNVPGVSLRVKDDEGKSYDINLRRLAEGFQVMHKKYPKHFADFIAGNDDATTGDVFLQCALFGELVYG